MSSLSEQSDSGSSKSEWKGGGSDLSSEEDLDQELDIHEAEVCTAASENPVSGLVTWQGSELCSGDWSGAGHPPNWLIYRLMPGDACSETWTFLGCLVYYHPIALIYRRHGSYSG